MKAARRAKTEPTRARRGATASLARYRKMRDFGATPEPAGGGKARKAARAEALSFVVQRHDATRLHYDFRLELDGVLKSWAVPKGPSMVPGHRRLAVETEDHPLEYGSFEGAIPAGHYGAGHVLLWDRGTWTPEGDPHAGLAKGHLRFTLHGDKLAGSFSLVRTRAQGKKQQWLLLKHKDAAAAEEGTPEVTTPLPVPPLGSVRPQLATLGDALPEGEAWLFEPKLDGYRALAALEDGEVQVVTRSGQDWTERFQDIADAIAELPIQSAIFDGEVCALDDAGKPSFQRLQSALKSGGELVYFVFDVLFLDGFDVRDRPLEKRKAMLESILSKVEAPLSYVAHVESGEAPALLDLACRGGLEGLVAKRREAPYVSRRTRDWIKIKCQQRQEMVIVGYTAPKGSRAGLGALLLGVHERGRLRYAGKVGTGFSVKTLTALHRLLQPLTARAKPPAGAPRLRDATWVRPERVCEVTFTEWTADGALRHPVFVGLREDKPASEVVREHARARPRQKTEAAVTKKKKKATRKTAAKKKATAKPKPRAAKARTKAKPRTTKAEPRSEDAPAPAARTPPSRHPQVAGVPITHADRVIDAASGLTKLELAEYQVEIAARLMPYIHRRPLALVRCPEGDQGECFFQKHRTPGMPDSIHGDRIGDHGVLYVEDVPGLVALVQFGAVELHGWGSRMDAPTQPDWIVMDLDPDEDLPFSTVVDAALLTRDLLAKMGLTSFVKTTGGKGLHVVAPIAPQHDFEAIKALTHALSTLMAHEQPQAFTAVMAKKQRTGKIFVDYLRNGQGATAIMPYSARARPGATVAYPLSWRELKGVDPRDYTVKTVPARLRRRRTDPWAELVSLRQKVPAAVETMLRKLTS